MNERKTTTLPDGTKVLYIGYSEMPEYQLSTCELCAVNPTRESGQPCYVNKGVGCGGGLYLNEAEFAAARVGVVPSIKAKPRRGPI